jgi:hypothetical protein
MTTIFDRHAFIISSIQSRYISWERQRITGVRHFMEEEKKLKNPIRKNTIGRPVQLKLMVISK